MPEPWLERLRKAHEILDQLVSSRNISILNVRTFIRQLHRAGSLLSDYESKSTISVWLVYWNKILKNLELTDNAEAGSNSPVKRHPFK
ncbi:MAG: hypothetical protein ACOZBH_04860 [Patescibacteria group bacterium]